MYDCYHFQISPEKILFMLKPNFRRYAVRVGFALIGLIAAAPTILAQLAGSATINGTVTDASGATVSGVTITLHQTGTGADRECPAFR
jgi:hypothetical protein